MLKKIFYVASILLFNSCIGDIEKLKLDKYSEKNKSYEIEVFEKHFDEKDSLLSQKIKLMVFDRKNRLINENNSIFYFYNSKNKINEVKSIYRRGLKTSILEYDYLYDKNGNLKFIIYNNDTIQYFLYDKYNQLIEKGNRVSKFKTTFKRNDKNIIEETEYENGGIAKHSKFKYDSKQNKIINNWVFNRDQQMKTYYKYNTKNKLISERDSCITTFGNPNEFVEFLTEYYYDKNDSISEKRELGRVLSEKEMKLRGSTKFEYKKL